MRQANWESDPTYTFGNTQPYVMERLRILGRISANDTVELVRPQINEADYYNALEDINRTFRLITDPYTQKQFEIAVANTDKSYDQGVDVELSTYTSSLSGNPGNAVEFAENAALHPDKPRVYVSSFGNGGSAYWDLAERKYIRKTGRFVGPDGQPLNTIQALIRALQDNELQPTRCFSANSAGGSHTTAMLSGLPDGQATHAYTKGRTNLSNHNYVMWGPSMLINDIVDDRRYKQVSTDPWKLTDELIAEAKEKLPNIYQQGVVEDLVTKAKSSHGVKKMATDLVAYSRGGKQYDHPAVQDTIAALKHQPEIKWTFHMAQYDRVYKSRVDLFTFLRKVCRSGVIDEKDTGQIEMLIAPGTHRDHTRYPGVRWAAEDYAFSR